MSAAMRVDDRMYDRQGRSREPCDLVVTNGLNSVDR